MMTFNGTLALAYCFSLLGSVETTIVIEVIPSNLDQNFDPPCLAQLLRIPERRHVVNCESDRSIDFQYALLVSELDS